MATYLADRVIVFDGQASLKTVANSPECLLTGMNRFLKSLEVTIRRDRNNSRPRINRKGSARVRKKFVVIEILKLKLKKNYFHRMLNKRKMEHISF
jgi:translation initiation factor RLI1